MLDVLLRPMYSSVTDYLTDHLAALFALAISRTAFSGDKATVKIGQELGWGWSGL